jgi:hypothetical protein
LFYSQSTDFLIESLTQTHRDLFYTWLPEKTKMTIKKMYTNKGINFIINKIRLFIE